MSSITSTSGLAGSSGSVPFVFFPAPGKSATLTFGAGETPIF